MCMYHSHFMHNTRITIRLFFQPQEYATCDPEYYKWTQFIFLKMFEAGLVEQREVLAGC